MRENFMKGSYGVFIHYLVKYNDSSMSAEEWNEQTESFDAEGLARQLHEVGAKWLFFTMGQASGHYTAPNAVFDEISGDCPSKCSKRDLPLALYDALKPYGIRLCLYMPSEGPKSFGWHFLKNRETGEITNDRQVEFQLKWERVITEWSLRYGERISAWWVDSCYFPDIMYDFPDRPNFHSFAGALRAGNPNALLAFNNGVRIPTESVTDEDDYTAGELVKFLPIAFDRMPISIKTKDGITPIDKSPLQYHLLCSLGRDWGHLVKTDEPRFPDALVSSYTEYILGMGGAITWEVPVNTKGLMSESFVRQLSITKKHIARIAEI